MVLVVDERGVFTDPAKVGVVREWAMPTNLQEVNAFLSFVSYMYYKGIFRNFTTLLLGHVKLTFLVDTGCAHDLPSKAVLDRLLVAVRENLWQWDATAMSAQRDREMKLWPNNC